ncbi:hypothetical protein uan_113 [Pseudomonas phage UAntarctica]|nr:hypothetical protein uan_113 [Pseudomonas phage UAntarctica]
MSRLEKVQLGVTTDGTIILTRSDNPEDRRDVTNEAVRAVLEWMQLRPGQDMVCQAREEDKLFTYTLSLTQEEIRDEPPTLN